MAVLFLAAALAAPQSGPGDDLATVEPDSSTELNLAAPGPDVVDDEASLAAEQPENDEPVESLAGGHPHKEHEKLIKFLDERNKNGYNFEYRKSYA